MNNILTGLLTTSVVSLTLIPAHSASAEILQDIGIGAAGSAATGEILDNGSTVENAIGGAVTGAVVGATHNDRNDNSATGILQDAAVGAAANTITGEILGNGETGKNAIGGAVTGVIINVTK